VTAELLSPIYSRFVPARSGCVRRSPVSAQQRHHSLEGPINLARACVLIGIRVSIIPSRSSLHCSRSTSRDFVHWRFSYACRRRARIGSSRRRPKTLYGADFVKGVPCGAYRYFSTSVSLFDLDNPFPRPDPYEMRWSARAEAVKDGARSATRKGFVLDGFEHDGTLVVVGMTKVRGEPPRVVHEHSCHILVFGG
jgi:hypothetical protein